VTWSSVSDSFTCTTITLSAANFTSQTANTFLAAPNGAAGVPTFRDIVAADLPTVGTAGTYGSASSVPVFTTDVYGRVTAVTNTAITANATTLTGVVPISKGGTGTATAPTQYGVIYAASGTSYASTAAGTDGYALIANSGAGPSFQQLDISTAAVTGILPVARGGTGAASTTAHYAFIGPTSGTGAPTFRALALADLPAGSVQASGTTAGYVPYFTDADSLGNSAMYYTASKVGVGTTSPAYTLDVNGDIGGTNLHLSAASPYIYSGGSYIVIPNGLYVSGGTPYFANQIQARGGIHNDNAAYLTVAGGTSGVTYFSGSVGIGVSAPGQSLEVSGNVKATSFISTSDRRLKKDIETVDGLDTILKLRGVKFKWKANNQPEYGTIAQEVEQVLPDLVVTDPHTGLKAVKYLGLIAPLIEATKDLNNKCDMSTEQLNKLAVALENVQADVSTLKRKLASVEDENAQMKEELKALATRLQALEDKEK
jgi:hypothetical protein